MRRRVSAAWFFFVGAALVGGPPGAGAAGTIDTTNAVFTNGAGSPSGTTTINANAPPSPFPSLPPLGDIGVIGTMTGSLPAFPGPGTGADGTFNAAVDTALVGGTYNYSSFTVTDDAVIDYSGAVVIHVTGAVSLDGLLRTTAADASIEIRCGGDFDLISESTTPNGIDVIGAGAEITVHVGGDARLGTGGNNDGSRLQTIDGTVRVIAHGLTVVGGDVVTDRLGVNARVGVFECQAAQSIQLGRGRLFGAGGVAIQAFGAGLTCDGVLGSNDADILMESALGLSLTSDADARSEDGDMTLRSFGGDLVLDGSFVESDGEVTAHASGSVRFSDGGRLEGGVGPVDIRAFGGDVVIGAPGGTESVLRPGPGGGTLVATADVIVENALLEPNRSAAIVRALGGEFRLGTDGEFDASDSVLDVRAQSSIRFTTQDCVFTGELKLSAGSGGIDLDTGGRELSSEDAGCEILSTGPIRMRVSMDVNGDLTIRSADGDIDFVGPNVDAQTFNGNAAPSGSIRIETSSPGCILATDLELETGSSDVKSGDIELLVHGSGGGGDPPDDVKSFFLPKKVVVKTNAAKPEKSTLIAVGFFDVGPGNPDLAGEATLDVGGLSVTADLDVAPNGKSVRLRSAGFDFLVKPSRTGSSRAKFKLKVQRDLAGQVPTEGELALRFRRGDIDGTGRVVLQGGKYKLGKKRGLLVAPVVFPFKAKAKVSGGGKDSLAVLAGIATDDAPPANAPDVTVTFVDLQLTVSGADFEQTSPGVFLAKNPPSAPGVKKVTVDYVREQVSFSAKDIDLGVIADGAFDVVLGVQVGESVRTVEVTAVRKGKTVKY